ncbi:MAG TPA: DUF1326 domain-containing protein [Vicinamibacterales bacterium]|jgi:hypothetical protein
MAALNVSGDVLIACNCDWGCPCNFNARPSKGFCEGGWIWMIERGSADDVDVSGRGVAVFAKWPAAIHEGGGRAICYVDDGADGRQRSALARLLRGELGGPWGIFIKTYEIGAPVVAPFDVRLDAYESCARIGADVELDLGTIRNPVTQADVHPEMVLPEGLVVKRGALAVSGVFRLGGDLRFDHAGQYAAFGRFEYS